ncbi:MAG: hypothetical protein ACRDGA_03575 [Bacteroidota bacterium]
MKRARMLLLLSAVVIEIAAVILIVKAIATDSSPTEGLVFLSFGLIVLLIGLRKKPESGKTDAS